MARSYFVETAAEAEHVVERLVASGFVTNAKPLADGYIVFVDGGPSVTMEETFLRQAPSARRVDI
ncbi:hypothetical protein [Microlunatus ginsengisoli]